MANFILSSLPSHLVSIYFRSGKICKPGRRNKYFFVSFSSVVKSYLIDLLARQRRQQQRRKLKLPLMWFDNILKNTEIRPAGIIEENEILLLLSSSALKTVSASVPQKSCAFGSKLSAYRNLVSLIKNLAKGATYRWRYVKK